MQKKERNIKPGKAELRISKVLILFGLASALFFLHWLLDPQLKGHKAFYFVFISVFLYKILSLFAEWFLSVHPSISPKPPLIRNWKVDVLTTYVKGEPKKMLKESLIAIKNLNYPHETYLCDEEDDPELKTFCKEHHIHHISREHKINAKAGNINNALESVASGDICLILDPDHVVYPNFLEEVLPYFEDDRIGYVQVVQAYYNQYETVIAKAAAEQTYQFYGPVMMTLNTYGSVPAIGANCCFRRKALDSIGGHASGLTEDLHTSLLLQAKKWKSVYNPVIVSKGLVPWNFSGYCLQQLKWAKGSFDLLFQVFPKYFHKLSMLQILTFLCVPFFYLSGLFSLFDFIIPIIALVFAIIPIKVSIVDFIIHYTPLFFSTFIIRLYLQRWFYENHEKGTAFLGGTLFKTSWWATLTGFIYAVIHKKIPYIPTPKEFKYETPWKLLIPNFLLIFFSAFAIVYGLIRDYNPFYVFMAGLAFINIFILGTGSLMAMQHLIIYVHSRFKGSFISKGSNTRKAFFEIRHKLYTKIQKSFLAFGLILFLGIFMFFYLHQKEKSRRELTKNPAREMNDYGHFYDGSNYSEEIPFFKYNSSFVKRNFTWDRKSLTHISAFLDSCYRNNLLPFVALKHNIQACRAIDTGYLHKEIHYVLNEIRKRYKPLFLMLEKQDFTVHSDRKYAQLFSNLYYLADSFCLNTLIAWVWHTKNPASDLYIKDNQHFISWFMVETNTASFADKPTFSLPWKNPYPIPIILENNSPAQRKYHVTMNKLKTRGIFALIEDGAHAKKHKLPYNLAEIFDVDHPLPQQRRYMKHYIKGVAYNPAHDWRDNNLSLPLTKEKLEEDFKLIKEMGANSIRRYAPGLYDYNILHACEKHDLDLLYGFWFDPAVDYFRNTKKVKKYKRDVLKHVRKYHNKAKIIAWVLGNETWSLLKLYYGQPYLAVVRTAYLKMINELVMEIKATDTKRPVLAAEEHFNLPSSMHSYRKYVPSLDVFAVNSYYNENIRKLDTLAQLYLGDIPYLVSEFGTKGYWSFNYSDFIFDTLIWEQSSQEKANFYALQWKEYIFKNRERNTGGIAFCWQDRFEKTAIWFGITDIFGNRKPVYYALKKCFTGKKDLSHTIPHYKILLNEEVFAPGIINALAVSNDISERDKYFYKWMIYEDNSFRLIKETKFLKGVYTFRFSMPEKPENYRLYLYIKDNEDHVLSESRTLLMYEK
jgi:cellulose synthase (UDP-forming)